MDNINLTELAGILPEQPTGAKHTRRCDIRR